MTCIVALRDDDRMYMGSDSQLTYGYTKSPIAGKKMVRRKILGLDFLFGIWGSPGLLPVLEHRFPQVEYTGGIREFKFDEFLHTSFCDNLRSVLKDSGRLTTDNGQDRTDAGMILMVGGRIFSMDYWFQLTENAAPYATAGSGGSVALGALHATEGLPPRKRIRAAIRAACDLDIGCGPPIRIQSIPIQDPKEIVRERLRNRPEPKGVLEALAAAAEEIDEDES